MLIATGPSHGDGCFGGDNASPEDYRVRAGLQTAIIGGMARHGSGALRPNTVEIRDVFLSIDKARHPFVSRTMLPRDERRAFDFAVIADMGGICVALEQKRLRSAAAEAQNAAESGREEP
jgi:hypothetical protein